MAWFLVSLSGVGVIALYIVVTRRIVSEVVNITALNSDRVRLLQQNATLRAEVQKYGRTINRQGKRIHSLKMKLKRKVPTALKEPPCSES